MGAFLEQWLKDYAWPNLSPETALVYDIITRKHLVPDLGSILLQKLTLDRIQSYYTNKLANGGRDGRAVLSPRTVQHLHWLLHVALGVRQKEEADPTKPCRRCGTPELPPERDVNIRPGRYRGCPRVGPGPEYYPLFYTLLYTGLRRTEVLALRWQDEDVDLGCISVNRTRHQLLDKRFVFQ